MEIEFGTSGWRGKIADDFTYENVKIVTQAICDFLNEKYNDVAGVSVSANVNRGAGANINANANRDVTEGVEFNNKKIVIGYDTRFLSEEFAKCSAGVFGANGFTVLFCNGFTPTPVISVAILKEKALGAINITASHNPYNYNGIKFSPSWGGPALPEDTTIITEKSNKLLKDPSYKFIDYEKSKVRSLLKEVNYTDYYISLIKQKIDFNLIKSNQNIYIMLNPMHGASKGVIDKILEKEKIDFTEINPERDAFFGVGKAPDPSDKNLGDLKLKIKEYNKEYNKASKANDEDINVSKIVNKNKGYNKHSNANADFDTSFNINTKNICQTGDSLNYLPNTSSNINTANITENKKRLAIGIATDGDADRYGIIDENSMFVEPNIILAMLYNYYITGKGIKGDVARSVATSALVDRIARNNGFKVHETPVGFKYLGKLIEEKKVVMAGEESSGLTVIDHTPDKDGIFACLLVLEMVSYYKNPLAILVKEFLEKYGPIFTTRVNEPVDRTKFKATIDNKMEAFPDIFEGKKVINKSFIDGYKIFFDDDSWVLARLSGTEDVMRIYGESDSLDNLNLLIKSFKDYINN